MKQLYILSAIIILGNCLSMPSTANLPSPKIQTSTMNESIVLEKVKVLDFDVQSKNTVEDNLTLNLKNYLEKGKYFDKVILFTEKDDSNSQSKSFHFSFQKYSIVRKVYKWYFPLAICTLTLYIWFGGTTHIDEVIMNGSLEVKDSSENKLLTIKKDIFEERDINLYSDDITSPNSASARGKFFTEVLNEYQKKRTK